jgi:hypothetical protein
MLWQAFGRWGALGGGTGSGGTGGDANFASTVLLLGFEGADASTATSDESSANRGAATFFSNAQIDTGQAKFGSSSLLLDGAEDRITFPDSADWLFTSADDFTIEAWIRFNSLTGFQAICSHWTNSTQSWVFDWTGSNTLRFAYSTNGSDTVSVAGAWTPSTGTWYHVAADKSSGTLRVYANGVMLTSAGSIPSFNDAPVGLRIGTVGGNAGTEVNDFNGWIDELRITKGVARYASDSGYSVPTAAFPRS